MSKSYSQTILFAALLFFSGIVLSSCATARVNIPDNLSPAEIIQRAQEASDRSRYSIALQYYEALLERNPDNIELVCTAEYEIAFIHYKQKRYTQAKDGFNALLERYDQAGLEPLPDKFKILSNIVLLRIDEIENQRRPLSRAES